MRYGPSTFDKNMHEHTNKCCVAIIVSQQILAFLQIKVIVTV